MASASTATYPISDLMYDWLTVLQSKAEGLNAYEKYFKDAEGENSQECVAMFQKIREADAKQLAEIRDHVHGMIAKQSGK